MCRLRVSLGFPLLYALTLLLAAAGVSSSRASGSSPQAESSRIALASAARSAPDGQPAQITPRLRKARITRLTATPAELPASGGKVDLWAVVHSATKCLFSSTSEVNGLPSIRRCKAGKVSTNIELLENTRSSTETYTLRLTVKGLNGARTTRRVKVSVDGQTAGPVAPVITTQPADQSIGANQDVLFHATASGNPTPSVQWQVSTDDASSWEDIAGATSVYYVFLTNATDNHYEYRAVFINEAGSAMTNAATLTVPPESSTRFSGYLDVTPNGEPFTAVSASWIVPTVTCSPGSYAWAAEWPGIGWNTSVQQDGTQVACFNGVPSYDAWYEMVGDSNVNNGEPISLPTSTYPVSPGDSVTGSISISGSTWTLMLRDSTAKWTFSINIPSPTPPLNQEVAQWLVEGPIGCAHECFSLANFGAVRFTGATADLNGQTGPISAFSPAASQMTSGSTVLAAPGPLDSSGEDFTDTWYATN